jgi:CBS domain-containing protein
LKAKDIMTKNVAYLNPTATVTEAAQLMQKFNVGSVPVCDQSGVVGIVTDRDIVVRNVAHGTNSQSTSVREVMTSQVATTTPDTDLNDVSRIMSQNQIRRIPVVENNKVVGIVSLGDIATDAKFDTEVAGTLTDISKPNKGKK